MDLTGLQEIEGQEIQNHLVAERTEDALATLV